MVNCSEFPNSSIQKDGEVGMKAVIELDVPEWQIGQDVAVYFPDTMVKHCKCELLKEQENKKLIDADKLREKLGFAECCEDCKHDSWKCGRETIYSLYDFCTAIDIAIEELMQEGR